MIALISSFCVIGAIALTFLFDYCGVKSYNERIDKYNREYYSQTQLELKKVSSLEEINPLNLTYKKTLGERIKDTFSFKGNGLGNIIINESTSSSIISPGSSNSFETNEQVKGINEADVSKCDGKYIYTLNSETTLNGTNGIDTGIKLLDSNKAFTIFIDFTPQGSQINAARLLQCDYDVSPYNGIRVAIIGGSKYGMVYNGTANTDANGLGAINQYDETRHKLVITKEANSDTVKYYFDNTTAQIVNWTVDFGAIDNTLIFGYYTEAE